MKKSWLALAAVAVYLLSTGCAITNYPVISDNDQTGSSAGNHIVKTSGDALIVPLDGQVVTIYSDGADELLSFVDQDGNGNQTIRTYNNFCAAGAACSTDADGDGNTDWFAGMTFLNADHGGCWIWSAPNPATGDTDIFDGSFNGNCDGARSLKSLISYGGRLQESGKDGNSGRGGSSGGSGLSQGFAGGVSIRDAVGALAQLDSLGTYGQHPEQGLTGWKITLTPDNFEIWLDATRLHVDGVVAVLDVRNRIVALDARTGNSAAVMNQVADWVEANGQRATVSASFAGLSPTIEVGLMGADQFRALADRAGS